MLHLHPDVPARSVRGVSIAAHAALPRFRPPGMGGEQAQHRALPKTRLLGELQSQGQFGEGTVLIRLLVFHLVVAQLACQAHIFVEKPHGTQAEAEPGLIRGVKFREVFALVDDHAEYSPTRFSFKARHRRAVQSANTGAERTPSVAAKHRLSCRSR